MALLSDIAYYAVIVAFWGRVLWLAYVRPELRERRRRDEKRRGFEVVKKADRP